MYNWFVSQLLHTAMQSMGIMKEDFYEIPKTAINHYVHMFDNRLRAVYQC